MGRKDTPKRLTPFNDVDEFPDIFKGETCRFKEVRRLAPNDDARLFAYTEVQQSMCPPYPRTFSQACTYQDVKDFRRALALEFYPIVQNALEHSQQSNVLLKNGERKYRLLCDLCHASIFISSYICTRCHYEICVFCMEKPSPHLEMMSWLQQKIMFYGHPVERLCAYQYSLIALIPGLLQNLDDCGSLPLEKRAATLSKPTELRTSDPKSMMAYAGPPLDLFGKGTLFQPYLPLQQFDMLKDSQSWLCGSTNSTVVQQREVDLLVNVCPLPITYQAETAVY
ncbi:hypothetical protein NM688_g9454 [Phlebia brevispora]|uniref:Uncharacterized protein n=1 Tax=Phlebia brevispora TaxID=194682 RepID=A0ACC1RJS0_9APHY|nr:hypothetical protein NM688_g9454 [Phlebia brevispora]